MLKKLFREEPELAALAVIILFFAASVADPAGGPVRMEGNVHFPQLPDVRAVTPDLPPPVNPIELIRF